jgi:hypothetical protein
VLGTINNTGSGGVGEPTYTDHTATIGTTLAQGQLATLQLTGGEYVPDAYAAWIDYDQDEVFEVGEKLGEFTSSVAFGTVPMLFTVPADALTGTTRLRVRGVYHGEDEPAPTDPCYDYTYGETEDYGITIIEGTAAGYCIPVSASGTTDGDFVDGVVLGTIDNTGTGSVGGPTYTDHSSTFTTDLMQGTVVSMEITTGDYVPDQFAAWIDYDQDEIFEPTEKLGEFTSEAPIETRTIIFSVPADALVGATRLRVRGVFHDGGEPAPTDPCYDYNYGETEDYGITIVAGGGGGYCVPTSTGGTTDGDLVDGVELGTIDNTGTGTVGGPAYTDYSAAFDTELAQGATATITITSGPFAPDNYAVWIDYDQNLEFVPGEKVGEFITSAPGEVQSLSFTVPSAAVTGPTRLRVRGVFHGTDEPIPTDPCYPYAYAETEDYTVTIVPSTGGPCVPSSTFGTSDGDYIDGVDLEDINTFATGGPGGPAYTDYTALQTTLLVGSSYPLTITSGAYEPDGISAWIDLDQDGLFEEGERIGETVTNIAFQEVQFTVQVPPTAQPGLTVMRVRCVYEFDGDPAQVDPCYNYGYGETEDYGILIDLGTGIAARGGANDLMIRQSIEFAQVTWLGKADALLVMDASGRVILNTTPLGERYDIPLIPLASGAYVVQTVIEGNPRVGRILVVK